MESDKSIKFYYPKIEEFHVGFEFESNYVLFKKGNKSDVWNKHILTQDELWFWDSWKNDAVDTEFRVKYLDKEDIESLGWKLSNIDDINLYELTVKKFEQYGTMTFVLHIVPKFQNRIVIYFKNIINGSVLFRGDIKNKSELKKLMQQLNILNE
jgi:hypothetical protein